ncbi:hypothetical protein [Paenibacillus sp. B-A-8]|uniref:hypothetical protein n=1 Tax=Paenibacillus sp. B-A-8 TaxID=3400419 RepID=UPI003B026851
MDRKYKAVFYKLKDSAKQELKEVKEDDEINNTQAVPLELYLNLMKKHRRLLNVAENMQIDLTELKLSNRKLSKIYMQNYKFEELIEQMAKAFRNEKYSREEIVKALLKRLGEIRDSE